MVCSTLRFRDDVIYRQIARGEVVLATMTVSALLAVQYTPILFIVVPDDSSEVSALWNVSPMGSRKEQTKFPLHAVRHKVCGLGRNIYPDPLTV